MSDKDWMTAIAAAEQDLAELRHELDCNRHRLDIAKCDVAFFANRVDRARVECVNADRIIGEAYLRLMNSGISHRRFLAFVEQQEARA